MAGVGAALAAAVCFAVFQTVQRRALHGIDVYRGTAIVLAVAAAVLTVVAVATGDIGRVLGSPAAALGACAAAGLLHFGLGWTLLGVSQVRLGAARTGIVVGTVPLFGSVVAAVALDEPLGLVQGLGLLVTVAGVAVVVARPGARGRPRATVTAATGATGTLAAPSTAAPAPTGADAGDGADAGHSHGGGDDDGASVRVGVLAGLGTAACWSVSPVLIRTGLQDIGSPLLCAAVGMVTCAAVYGAAVAGTAGHRTPPRPGSRRLLAVSGTAVGVAILLQWTAFSLARIAVVLAVLQLTPPLVVGLASRIAGDAPEPGARHRVWVGAGLTVVGSLVLVLVG